MKTLILATLFALLVTPAAFAMGNNGGKNNNGGGYNNGGGQCNMYTGKNCGGMNGGGDQCRKGKKCDNDDDYVSVPEPATLAMLSLGLVALGAARAKKNKS